VTTTTTIACFTTRKRAKTIAIKPILNNPDSSIILEDKELIIIPIATSDSAIKSAYPKGPLLKSHPP
jgi:hypothetical protein